MIHLSQWFTTFFLLNKPKECSIAPSVTMALHGSDSAVILSKIGACVLGEGEGSILKKNPTNDLDMSPFDKFL